MEKNEKIENALTFVVAPLIGVSGFFAVALIGYPSIEHKSTETKHQIVCPPSGPK